MIIRIVRMTFQADKLDEFLEIFHSTKHKIRAQAGCRYLELWQDINTPNIMGTYSHWDSEQDLNNYRDSELFANVWGRTKVLFADKPIAFSIEQKEVLL